MVSSQVQLCIVNIHLYYQYALDVPAHDSNASHCFSTAYACMNVASFAWQVLRAVLPRHAHHEVAPRMRNVCSWSLTCMPIYCCIACCCIDCNWWCLGVHFALKPLNPKAWGGALGPSCIGLFPWFQASSQAARDLRTRTRRILHDQTHFGN